MLEICSNAFKLQYQYLNAKSVREVRDGIHDVLQCKLEELRTAIFP